MIQTETVLCGYCEEFPEKGRAAAAHVNRCPLCKAELGVTGSGQRFRIGDNVSAPRGRIAMVAALAFAGGVMVMAAVAWLAFSADPAEESVSLPPEPTPIVAASLPVVEPQAPAPPHDIAINKPYAEGVLSPEARLKPELRDSVAVASGANATSGPAGVPPENAGQLRLREESIVRAPPSAPGIAEAHRQWEFSNVAEIGLVQQTAKETWASAKQQIAVLAQEINDRNKKSTDGFVRSLIEGGGDLSGLPYQLGKTCELGTVETKALRMASVSIREALTSLQPRRVSSASGHVFVSPDKSTTPPKYTLWNHLRLEMEDLTRTTYATKPPLLEEKTKLALLPGLLQILPAEAPHYRDELVEQIQDVTGPRITQVLARLAVYDPDADVRRVARQALRKRPVEEWTDELIGALRYPWPAVAVRAVDTIVDLERKDLVPRLIDQLDAADPYEPFEKEVQGKKVAVVRQLVKINHHRNCLLCHAPSDTRNRDIPQGLVPSPSDPLPPSGSVAYYAQRKGETVVRADITYLRQDFSMLLPVAESGPWPQMQRFDFLVRTRVLGDAELNAFQQQKQARGPIEPSPHRQAVLSALRRLTGLDAGVSAAEWRKAIAAQPADSGK